jgi:hypothetical protein
MINVIGTPKAQSRIGMSQLLLFPNLPHQQRTAGLVPREEKSCGG